MFGVVHNKKNTRSSVVVVGLVRNNSPSSKNTIIVHCVRTKLLLLREAMKQ